jgi:hypothetical protein
MAKVTKPQISGKEATYVALEAQKYGPVHISALDNSAQGSDTGQAIAQVPVPVDATQDTAGRRLAPPRVRKSSPLHDQCLAPTSDLDGYRARLREALGNTMSEELSTSCLAKSLRHLSQARSTS